MGEAVEVRLREHGQYPQGATLRGPVLRAIADLVEAARGATTCESSHPRDKGRCGHCPPCRLLSCIEVLDGASREAESGE